MADAVLIADPENEDAITFMAMARKSLGLEPLSSVAATSPAVVEDQKSAAVAGIPTTGVGDSTTAPVSFVNGRYVVTGMLGEGGKKKVYLALDTTLDRDVAFALIKTEGLDDESRQRITREAQAMARLGGNPNIMRSSILVMRAVSRTWCSR
jgi:hypothetical protein